MKDYILDHKTQRHQVRLSAYGSTSARSYPVSLVFSGLYSWGHGITNTQGNHYYIWSSLTNSTESNFSYEMSSSPEYLTLFSNEKFFGFALRCVFPLALTLLVVIRCPWCCQEDMIGQTVRQSSRMVTATGGVQIRKINGILMILESIKHF